jgi:2-keto-3-deoxy-L-rhamnonate aldolase RhmA
MTMPVGNPLKNLLDAGRILTGIYHGYPAEGILETIGVGWDFVWIDAQHGQFSIESALRSVRTASLMGLHSVLRVPSHDPGLLGLFADTAAAAIMAPQVDSVAQAQGIVQSLRFPPGGKRSFGGRRPIDVHGRDYFHEHEPVIIAQIESTAALGAVREIASVDGIDGLFFGADDMKLSMGLAVGATIANDEQLQEAQRSIADAALATGKWCGMPAADDPTFRSAVKLGYQLLSCGGDVLFLRAGARQSLERSKQLLDELGQSMSHDKRKAASAPADSTLRRKTQNR